jgi:hypothetical protein
MRASRRIYYIDQLEATSIILRRLATPCRWVDLYEEFGKHSSALTEIFYHALEQFYSNFSTLLHVGPENIVRERADYYAKCVTERGAVLPHVVGFIDETSLEIARQRECSESNIQGHKSRICINFKQYQLRMDVAYRGRASGLYRVGITGTISHASPFTEWS